MISYRTLLLITYHDLSQVRWLGGDVFPNITFQTFLNFLNFVNFFDFSELLCIFSNFL